MAARVQDNRSKSPIQTWDASQQQMQKMSRYQPRNLEDVPAASDITNSNAPAMIHNKSPMARLKQQDQQEQVSYRKILGGIQKQIMTVEQ